MPLWLPRRLPVYMPLLFPPPPHAPLPNVSLPALRQALAVQLRDLKLAAMPPAERAAALAAMPPKERTEALAAMSPCHRAFTLGAMSPPEQVPVSLHLK